MMAGTFTYRIEHTTRHLYAERVSFSPHLCRFYPRVGPGVRVDGFCLQVQPEATVRRQEDIDGNQVLVCSFGLREATELCFTLDLRVERDHENPYDFILEPEAVDYPVDYRPIYREWLEPYLRVRTPVPEIIDGFLRESAGVDVASSFGRGTVEFLAELNCTVHRSINYERRDEEGIQGVQETLDRRRGSCRDMAWLFMEMGRHLGLATRFVSGYLFDPPDSLDAFNRAVGSMHAWAEVFLPGAGWKGFDPTNGILANHFFISTAVGGNPGLTDPISGTYFSARPTESKLETDLKISLL